MKQSAVEWLVEQLFKTYNNTTEKKIDNKSIIEQAKEMEKKKDEKYNEMLEMLKRLIQPDLDISDLIEAEQLIKKVTI